MYPPSIGIAHTHANASADVQTKFSGKNVSLLKSLNRHMERNQAARMALLGQLDQAAINDMDDFSRALWQSIHDNISKDYILEIMNSENLSFEFVIKLLIKIGFSSDNAVRLMMNLDNHGAIVLAMADERDLLDLERYIQVQASRHGLTLPSRIKKA